MKTTKMLFLFAGGFALASSLLPAPEDVHKDSDLMKKNLEILVQSEFDGFSKGYSSKTTRVIVGQYDTPGMFPPIYIYGDVSCCELSNPDSACNASVIGHC
jgi:hypothetical protein